MQSFIEMDTQIDGHANLLRAFEVKEINGQFLITHHNNFIGLSSYLTVLMRRDAL